MTEKIQAEDLGPFQGVGTCYRSRALQLHNCPNLQLRGLTHVNSSKGHIGISYSQNVTLSHLNISAPESSPNTDGIDLYSATNVSIHQSTITTAWEALEQVEHMKELKKCLWEIVLLKGLCMEQGSRPGRPRQSQFEQCDIYWSEGNQRCAECNHVELCRKHKLHKYQNEPRQHNVMGLWRTHQVSANGTSSCTPAVPCLHRDCLGLRYEEDEDFVF